MTESVLLPLRTLLQDDAIEKVEVVQRLWSGYGEIGRYYSKEQQRHFIVKQVNVPDNIAHPRGWNTQTSHQRKLKSYQVEQYFYRHFSTLCDEHCRVPKLLVTADENMLVMEDLDESGFEVRRENGDSRSVELGIKWLAYFHARFMGAPTVGLWPVGTYWHFHTRQDEWRSMPESPLKSLAKDIDQRLNQATYQTLLHGDAKLANFCFDVNGKDVASVDFQYTGRGCGMKDLAYFLGCCFDDIELLDTENSMLDCYFSYLKQALELYQVTTDLPTIENEWRELYPFAWADFYRFLAGWSPEHYKINPYMQRQFDRVSKTI